MVIIGAGLMTSLNGLGGGMDVFIEDQLGTLGANILIITPSNIQGGFGPPQDTQEIKLTSQTVKTIERISGIKYVVPFFSGSAVIRSGGEERSIGIEGMDQTKLEYITPKFELESGSLVLPQDSSGILLGYNIAYPSDLDRPLAKQGQTVYLEYSKIENEGGREKVIVERKSFQVRGIIAELGSMTVDNYAYISLAAANSLFEKSSNYDGIYGITHDPEENEEVEEKIRKIYGENIGITTPKAIAETIQEVMGTFESFISAIAAVSMFVGAVGIITTLYTSVMERTREVGLLKALGYGKQTILLMFLTESMAIGILGALLGLGFGVVGSYILIRIIPFGAEELSFSPYFMPMDIIQIFLISFTLSIIAGLYPAWRASKLSPINALRKE